MPCQRVLYRRSAALACAVALAGFLANSAPGEARGKPELDPDPTWQELLQIITSPNKPKKAYTSWQPMPEAGMQQKVLSLDEQPHGDGIVVYVNEVARQSLEAYDPDKKYGADDLFEMKPGSILIKENYPSSSKVDLEAPLDRRQGLLSMTVLWKVPGYDLEQPLALEDPHTQGLIEGTHIPKNPSQNQYLIGGEWFYAMFPGCCFQQKPEGSDAACPAWGSPSSCNIETLGSEGFMTSPPRNRHIFPAYAGEAVTGKAWFCQSCHNGATGVGKAKKKSYGDYIFKLTPFHSSGGASR